MYNEAEMAKMMATMPPLVQDSSLVGTYLLYSAIGTAIAVFLLKPGRISGWIAFFQSISSTPEMKENEETIDNRRENPDISYKPNNNQNDVNRYGFKTTTNNNLFTETIKNTNNQNNQNCENIKNTEIDNNKINKRNSTFKTNYYSNNDIKLNKRKRL